MNEEVIVTGEFVKNAKHLYRTALRVVRGRESQAKESADEVARHFRLLHKALTRFNYGYDPLENGGKK